MNNQLISHPNNIIPRRIQITLLQSIFTDDNYPKLFSNTLRPPVGCEDH